MKKKKIIAHISNIVKENEEPLESYEVGTSVLFSSFGNSMFQIESFDIDSCEIFRYENDIECGSFKINYVNLDKKVLKRIESTLVEYIQDNF